MPQSPWARLRGNATSRTASRPSRARFARTGEAMPPWGCTGLWSDRGWGAVHKTRFQPLVQDGLVHRDMGFEPCMTDFCRSTNITLEDPWRRPPWEPRREALGAWLGWRALRPEAVGVRIACRFGDGLQGQQIERLHRPVVHRRDARELFASSCHAAWGCKTRRSGGVPDSPAVWSASHRRRFSWRACPRPPGLPPPVRLPWFSVTRRTAGTLALYE